MKKLALVISLLLINPLSQASEVEVYLGCLGEKVTSVWYLKHKMTDVQIENEWAADRSRTINIGGYCESLGIQLDNLNILEPYINEKAMNIPHDEEPKKYSILSPVVPVLKKAGVQVSNLSETSNLDYKEATLTFTLQNLKDFFLIEYKNFDCAKEAEKMFDDLHKCEKKTFEVID